MGSEPMEGDECIRDVVCVTQTEDEPCCRVHHRLKSAKKVDRKTDQNGISDSTSETIRVWNVIVGTECRMDRSCLRTAKYRETVLCTCVRITRSASTKIPGSRTDWTGSIVVLSTRSGDLGS